MAIEQHHFGQPHRRKLEPSRSMPPSTRRPHSRVGSPSASPNILANRGVVQVTRQIPRRTISGKANNPYKDENSGGILSPKRKSLTVQVMANAGMHNSAPTGHLADGDNDWSNGDRPKMPQNEGMMRVKSHMVFPDEIYKDHPLNGSHHGIDTNDKHRRAKTSILNSLFKALFLLAMGFGAGYLYSHEVEHNAPPIDLAPWGYSPADPLVQKLLQHNDHKDVIEDIKNLKFPGRVVPEPDPPIDIHVQAAEKVKEAKASAATDLMESLPENPPPAFRHSEIRLRGAPEPKEPPPPENESNNNNNNNQFDPDHEKLVHVVNKSARKIRLFWMPTSSATADQLVPMSDPYIDDGQDFYLHARPTHMFAVMELDGTNSALEFTVLELEQQTVLVYDNWVLEVKEDSVNTVDGPPVIHENRREQNAPEQQQQQQQQPQIEDHPPPEYMKQEQNSEEYWRQQREQQEQREREQEQAN